MPDLPAHARCVVIGGGIMGCSVAYHLAHEGWTDVVLLERHRLTSGSTFHAAGLVGQLRANANITRLLTHSVELYARLEAETGQASGWKMNGGLRLACTPDRMVELRRQATTARSFGLEMHLLTPDEAGELWPLMEASDLVGAAFLPTDGQANPSDITQALARGARQQGVRIAENCPVTGFRIERGRVAGVVTALGEIGCEAVALCAGYWSKPVAALAGVRVPLQAVQHQYMVSERIEGVTPDLPTLRDPDRLIYFKEEVGGLVMGGYERNPIPWASAGIPDGFQFSLLDPDVDHFEPFMAEAVARVPALETAGMKELINGPESFTPDGNFILGEAPELQGFYVGCGFNAFGIAAGGGAGKALAAWIAGGEPPYDLWPVDIGRFGPPHADDGWTRSRTLELYGKHYTIAWPGEEHASGRPLRRSPLYDRLKAEGAVFGEKFGFERVNWFARPGRDEPCDVYGFGRPNWFDAVAEEHRACREVAALFDASSFAKFELQGPDAERALGWIAANDVRVRPGRVVYTQMLNRHGGIECDLTVSRLADDLFYIVTGTGFATHDAAWIRRSLPEGADVRLREVTSALAVLPLMGPKARAILRAATDDEVTDEALPFGTWRTIRIAGAPVRALRITYVGELGFELHLPVEYALTVFERLVEAGRPHGLRLAGYRAIESLRLEKGYRAWGADIGPDHTPLEAGLAFAVKLGTDVPFLGRDALERQRAHGVRKRLVGLTLDRSEVVLLGRETILRDGMVVGWLTSGGFGHTIGKPIGYGYVRNPDGVSRDWLMAGEYALEVAGEPIAATLQLRPPYDPEMSRIRS
ncbi:MAG TPA: FAD-dependent oxidoreductase [Geminicoccaceae bacterium]